MKILNTTKNTVIAEHATVAETFFARITGLLHRTGLSKNEALLIVPCNSIHMFFMKFPIDAIFVDKEYRVVGLVEAIKPFQVSPVFWRAHFVIEGPAGMIRDSKTALGDFIDSKD